MLEKVGRGALEGGKEAKQESMGEVSFTVSQVVVCNFVTADKYHL